MLDSPSSTKTLRVLLVEDSHAMQEIMTAVLRDIKTLDLVGIAETADEAMNQFSSLQPDLVILDLGLREGSALGALHTMKAARRDCRVYVFTSFDADIYRERCFAAGADRFFSKIHHHRELVAELKATGS